MMRATDRLAQFERDDTKPSPLGALRDASYVALHGVLLYTWVPIYIRVCAGRHATYFHEDLAGRLLLALIAIFPVMLGFVVMGLPGRPVAVALLSYLMFAIFAMLGLKHDFSIVLVGEFVSHIERDGYLFAALAGACLVGYVVFLIWHGARRPR